MGENNMHRLLKNSFLCGFICVEATRIPGARSVYSIGIIKQNKTTVVMIWPPHFPKGFH